MLSCGFQTPVMAEFVAQKCNDIDAAAEALRDFLQVAAIDCRKQWRREKKKVCFGAWLRSSSTSGSFEGATWTLLAIIAVASALCMNFPIF